MAKYLLEGTVYELDGEFVYYTLHDLRRVYRVRREWWSWLVAISTNNHTLMINQLKSVYNCSNVTGPYNTEAEAMKAGQDALSAQSD